ncbi:hypothetical protein RSAG8_04015, partial [Rhizoctonia solani AG-8 WAC10335]
MSDTFPGYALVIIILGVLVLIVVAYKLVAAWGGKPLPSTDVEATPPPPEQIIQQLSPSQDTLPSYQIATSGRPPVGTMLGDK